MTTKTITRGQKTPVDAGQFLGAITGGTGSATIAVGVEGTDANVQSSGGGGDYTVTLGGFVPLDPQVMAPTKGLAITISGTGTVTGHFFNLL